MKSSFKQKEVRGWDGIIDTSNSVLSPSAFFASICLKTSSQNKGTIPVHQMI